MPVRKTESRIPFGFQASDLGEAVVAADQRCALVSFATAPIIVNRENVYVLFVPDGSLAATAHSFEWTFQENGETTKNQTTEASEIVYQAQTIGNLNVSVRILDAGNAQQARLTLGQEVVLPSFELEAFITDAQNKPGPGAGDPEILRELVNEYSRYYQGVKPQASETGAAFERFTFSIVSASALQNTATERRQKVEQLATALNDEAADFVRLAADGVGVSGIRLALLAMTLPQSPDNPTTLLGWTELPESANQRAFADEQLRGALGALEEATRIDLFNLARFPKSNITQCGRILEILRNRYFNGANFEDVLTGMSGTRAHWITRHYREGPLQRI
jgi:hypothetical protein